jgi:two-component system chemotaxis sensor kinase CheA
MDFEEEIKEFLIESNENLASLDREIVELEQNPGNLELISSAFRAIHTIKGTSGFFGFNILGSLTHMTENLLSDVREGRQKLTPELISIVLESIDEVKRILDSIESTGEEGQDTTADLRSRLEASLAKTKSVAPAVELAAAAASIGEARADGNAMDLKESASVQAAPLVLEASPRGPVVSQEAPQEPKAAANAKAYIAAPDANDGAAETAADRAREGGNQLIDSTIRVDVGLLNSLMNLVGELVLARNQLLQEAPSQSSSLQQTSQRLNLITSELQEGVMKTRMQPIGMVWSKLPRVVRDLAAHCGKKVRLEMEGTGTELDKTIIEAIKDPLTHIVRNCCDHGIEAPSIRVANNKKAEGLILLRAFHEGGVVNIEISDDGAGIDPERVKAKAVERGLLRPEHAALMSHRDALHLIFMPGFSTAAQVTSISGRGVGMDVVKSNIERIGGNVEVLSRRDNGTTIRIKIPLTLAIIPGLVVTLHGAAPDQGATAGELQSRANSSLADQRWRAEERFIIPQANLLELVRIESTERSHRIDTVHGTPIFRHRGELLPLIYLGRVLGRQEEHDVAGDAVNIVVLQVESRKIGLVVDRICDTQEIVVKPLGRQLKGLACYVGATIMGDGRPALILDVAGLSRLAGLGAQGRALLQDEVPKPVSADESQMLLLFRAGKFSRIAVPLALVDRLEEVSTSSIEQAAGRPVLHYRGDILPLMGLEEFLEAQPRPWSPQSAAVHVIVFSDGGRRMGLVVDQIVDIVDEVVTAPRGATVSGLLGSAVVGGKITDLLDLHALLSANGDSWLGVETGAASAPRRVLLVEDSRVAREMVHGLLRISGYATRCASTVAEALTELHQQPVDLVLMATDLAGADGGAGLLKAMRADASLRDIPVVGLRPENKRPAGSGSFDGYDVCLDRSDREGLKSAIRALTSGRMAELEVACR